MSQYKVDEKVFASYIQNIEKREIIKFLAIALLILFLQSIVFNQIPVWISMIIFCIVFAAFFWSLKVANALLKKMNKGQYYLSTTSITFQDGHHLIKGFDFEEIVIIHKKYTGTILVKGNAWTKFNYFRPKRTNTYSIDAQSVIFIPKITSNYLELIQHVQASSEKAFKLNY